MFVALRHDTLHTQTNHLLSAMMKGVESYLKKSKETSTTTFLESPGAFGKTGIRRANKIKYILQTLTKEFSCISDNKDEVSTIRLKALFLLSAVFQSTSTELKNDFFIQLLGINSTALENLYYLQNKNFIAFENSFKAVLKPVKITIDADVTINQIFTPGLALDIFNKCKSLESTLHGVASDAFVHLNQEDTNKAIAKIKNSLNHEITSENTILEYLNRAVLISHVGDVELVTYRSAI